jgi:hypothetical protein
MTSTFWCRIGIHRYGIRQRIMVCALRQDQAEIHTIKLTHRRAKTMSNPNLNEQTESANAGCAPANGSEIDANVQAVRRKMLIRAERGLDKYGVTTERTDLDTLQWLQHAQEEAMDLAVYLERLMADVRRQMDSLNAERSNPAPKI